MLIPVPLLHHKQLLLLVLLVLLIISLLLMFLATMGLTYLPTKDQEAWDDQIQTPLLSPSTWDLVAYPLISLHTSSSSSSSSSEMFWGFFFILFFLALCFGFCSEKLREQQQPQPKWKKTLESLQVMKNLVENLWNLNEWEDCLSQTPQSCDGEQKVVHHQQQIH